MPSVASLSLHQPRKSWLNGRVPTDPAAYGAVISRNVVAARARARLKQSEVATRMRALGYSWHPQTVGEIEKGNRRLTADETLGLAEALGVSVAALLAPSADDELIRLPSGDPLPAAHVGALVYGRNFGAVTWDGDKPVFTDQKARGFRVTMPTPDPGVFTVDFPVAPYGEDEST